MQSHYQAFRAVGKLGDASQPELLWVVVVGVEGLSAQV